EHWIVVRGTAEVTINGSTSMLSENESTYIPIGGTHRLANPGRIELELIEVQTQLSRRGRHRSPRGRFLPAELRVTALNPTRKRSLTLLRNAFANARCPPAPSPGREQGTVTRIFNHDSRAPRHIHYKSAATCIGRDPREGQLQ